MTVEKADDRLTPARIALYGVGFVAIAGWGIFLEYISQGAEMAVNLGLSYIIVLMAVILTILCILFDRKLVEMFRAACQQARAS